MYAALFTGVGQVELREFPDPTPTNTGVVVDISYCGVCGTDVHAFQSGRPYPPAVCGHEWTGTISAKGADVGTFSEGDRVIVSVPQACRTCAACLAGYADKCQTVMLVATGRDEAAAAHGGFASRIAVDRNRIMLAHPDLSDEQLAQVEPTTIAVHAMRGSHLGDGDLAVIQGAGPIGLTMLQLANRAGAASTIVIEPNVDRRALALDLGATAVIAPAEAPELVLETSNGLGADIVFECVGRPETLQDAVTLARRGGSVCLIGLADGDVTITPSMWLRREIRVTAALGYTRDEFAISMDMMAAGSVVVDPLHTSTASVSSLGDVLLDLASGSSEQTKVLINTTWE